MLSEKVMRLTAQFNSKQISIYDYLHDLIGVYPIYGPKIMIWADVPRDIWLEIKQQNIPNVYTDVVKLPMGFAFKVRFEKRP